MSSYRATFKKFGEAGIARLFRRNPQIIGRYKDNKSLTTIIHEGITNAIDAAEFAGILPSISVSIRPMSKINGHRIIIEDNGPGVPKELIPEIFEFFSTARDLERVQTRGTQTGIGISGVLAFTQLVSGEPAKIVTSTNDSKITSSEVIFDPDKGYCKTADHGSMRGEWRGTRIEFRVKNLSYQNSKREIVNYLSLTSLSNPHVSVSFEEPNGSISHFGENLKEMPYELKRIPRHPKEMTSASLLELARETKSRKIGTFLVRDLSRFSRNKLSRLEEKVTVDLDKGPSKLTRADAEEICSVFKKLDFRAPSIKGMHPIGETQVEKGLRQLLDPEFVFATTRPPKVRRGGVPFLIEVGIAYGGDKKNNLGHRKEGLQVIRFANKAPLIFESGSCTLTSSVRGIDWERYNVYQEKSPVTVLINIVSPSVPYKSLSRQSLAGERAIPEEVEKAVMYVARKLKPYLRGKINKAGYQKSGEIDRKKLKKLFVAGFSDEEIAERLRCSPNSVQKIRTEELGLRRDGKKPWKAGEPERISLKELERLFSEDLSDEVIADRLNLKKTVVTLVRQNVPDRTSTQDFSKKERRYSELYRLFEEGYTDEEIAAELSLLPRHVKEIREKKLGLKKKGEKKHIGIPHDTLKSILEKAGDKKVSNYAVEKTAEILEKKAKQLATNASALADRANRSTIRKMHITGKEKKAIEKGDRGEIKRLFKEGLSDKEISKKLGYTSARVKQIRTKELGLKREAERRNKTNSPPTRRRAADREEGLKDKVLNLLKKSDEELSIRDISRELNLSKKDEEYSKLQDVLSKLTKKEILRRRKKSQEFFDEKGQYTIRRFPHYKRNSSPDKEEKKKYPKGNREEN